ncbi:MAG: lipopolysaccharide kinase InaA family protein [Pseudomonadales bacterium]|nr:lipopolysaccharide kinase InaA family protein [Pseudomonadales bacterium]|tara:strand:- start:3031 stop:3840 length:810 start_codon:yes stop_codon:yes gene_type:complete
MPHLTYIAPDIDKQALHDGITSVLSDRRGWSVVKNNARNLIAYQENGRLYFKSFNNVQFKELIKRSLGSNRAYRTLTGTRLLTEAGCLAPTIIACGHHQRCDFILMEDLEGPQLLNALESFLQSASTRPWRRELFRALGHMVGRMHSAKIAHGDLRPNNIIIHPGSLGYRLALIDNERTRKPLRFGREQKRNLKQVMLLANNYITPAERRRFFAAYFSRLELPRHKQRRLYRETLESVREHFARKGVSRGTPISQDYWYILRHQQPDYR